MAVNKELTEFVKEGIGRGLPREQLHGVLISAGWPADQVQTAFNNFADVTFPSRCRARNPTSSPAWTNERAVRRDPDRRLSKVRRWLTYMTLFVAASVLIGDVTTVVYNFLGGEMAIRFVLKALTVGAIAGSVFGYLVRDLRKEEVAE